MIWDIVGECFYSVDKKTGLAVLDIKLLPKAQGKGIDYKGLTFVIEKAFLEGGARAVYVEPHVDNEKAWKSKKRPEFLDEWDTYLKLDCNQWMKK